jgi:hypothetical protein
MTSSTRPLGEPDKRFVEFVADERELDREIFDRIAYASRVLRILAPRLTVALCMGARRLAVEEGRGAGVNDRWAIVSIPADASRVNIAMALAKLARRENDPYVLDVLLRARPA